MNQEKIGKFISECRKECDLTQEELAEKLGVSNKTISRWETGKNFPDVSLLQPLCELLNISVNELLIGEKIPEDNYRKKVEENTIRILENSANLLENGKNMKFVLDENEIDLKFFGIIEIVFIILKLTGLIDWSWIWVLSPLWISLGLCVITITVFLIYMRKKMKNPKIKMPRIKIKFF